MWKTKTRRRAGRLAGVGAGERLGLETARLGDGCPQRSRTGSEVVTWCKRTAHGRRAAVGYLRAPAADDRPLVTSHSPISHVDDVVIGSETAHVTLSELGGTDGEGWRSFRVTLHGIGLDATRVVSDHTGFLPFDSRTGVSGLEALFQETADEYRGWEGAKQWESLEAQLSINVTTDRTGHATFVVKLYEEAGRFGWIAQIDIVLDVMERERLTKQLRSFFAQGAV